MRGGVFDVVSVLPRSFFLFFRSLACTTKAANFALSELGDARREAAPWEGNCIEDVGAVENQAIKDIFDDVILFAANENPIFYVLSCTPDGMMVVSLWEVGASRVVQDLRSLIQLRGGILINASKFP